jgi:hypothetical protein
MLEEALGSSGLGYVRYMDDILVLAPTRRRLRHVIRVLQQVFARLKLRTHPDKTCVERIERGLIFSAITSPATQSGSRSKPSSISWHGFTGFESKKRTAPSGAVTVAKYVTQACGS